MITAVDTNILIDSVQSREPSISALVSALESGSVIISPIVFAELSAGSDPENVARFFEQLGIEVISFTKTSLGRAGEFWQELLVEGGERRSRILPDFLIGSHALEHGDRILTRDRGFYRKYFYDLKVVYPS